MTEIPFSKAFAAIDSAHAEDPKKVTVDGKEIAYEMHYAQRMTHHLLALHPNASEQLQLAIRAQHFRRWEVPRDSPEYPKNKVGYFKWRTALKQRQAELVQQICEESGYGKEAADETGALVRKEGLGRGGKDGEVEVQALEDCACLVFLEDQLEAFEKEHDEQKVIDILQKSWKKMSEKGKAAALAMKMGERSQALVARALQPVGEAASV